MSDTRNVKLGVCNVFFGGQDLGYTKGGVEVSVTTETHKVEIDQFGKTPINELVMGRDLKVKVPLAETTLENMVAIMPGAVITETGGTVATGTILLATNPTTGQTLIVNGSTIKFMTAAAAADEVTIGANAAASAVALNTVLNASNDPLVAAATYTVTSATVTAKFGNFVIYGINGAKSVLGNAFTIGAGTSGATVSATLTGGADSTAKKIAVTTGIGTDLLTISQELRLHPVSKVSTDLSEDFIVPLAGTGGAMNYGYKVDDERVYNVEFTGYPDPVTGNLYKVGGR